MNKKEQAQCRAKSPQSKTFLYIKIPNNDKTYFCLQQNIAVLAWVVFFKKAALSPVVRPDLKIRWSQWLIKRIRSYAGLIKRNARVLMGFIEYKSQSQRWKSDIGVELPCYGQLCLPVHKGYKVFDFRRGAVMKVFDHDVDPSVIRDEIESLKRVSGLEFASSIKKWNIEERWYEEEYFNGSLDSSYTPMSSENVLTKFQDEVVHQLKAVILFQEAKATNAVTYLTDMIKRINSSRLARQESTVQEFKRIANFMNSLVAPPEIKEGCPIFLVFAHGDFVPANMLNTPHGMKIIDWEGAGYRSALFDFYSYFFYRSASRNIPVSTLISEVQKALPLFIAELAKNAQDISLSVRGAERVYRRTFYIEILCRLIEREMSDRNLNVMNYILKYIEVFNECEELVHEQEPT